MKYTLLTNRHDESLTAWEYDMWNMALVYSVNGWPSIERMAPAVFARA